MIDNYTLIKPFLSWNNEDEFYYLQIIQRRKENPGMTWDNRVIKEYYLYENGLEKRYEEIKQLCKLFNARAYIHLSKRNVKDIATDILWKISESFKNNNFKNLQNIYSSCVGSNLGTDKLWIIDLDNDKGFSIEEIRKKVANYKGHKEGDKILAVIPTKNGFHLISLPFDLMEFKKDFPNVDVQKNNPTILYIK